MCTHATTVNCLFCLFTRFLWVLFLVCIFVCLFVYTQKVYLSNIAQSLSLVPCIKAVPSDTAGQTCGVC